MAVHPVLRDSTARLRVVARFVPGPGGYEEDLTASDPDLAAAFDQVKRSPGGQIWWAVLVVAEITALLMVAVGLFSDRDLVFLAGVAAASALVWAHNTYRRAQRLPAWRSLW
ncbi:DUF3040 domain-containing protein [Amycolatopsis japonica]|uniref:DUF3040 domain-containing protein n=1 Tax=Amycolatopsis japonica TaxID=208439 RepID=UPI00332A0A6A